MPWLYLGVWPFGLELLVHLWAKAVHQHNFHAHALDHGQVLRQVRQLAGRNRFTRNTHHKGLVAELVDVRRHRPEPGTKVKLKTEVIAAWGGRVRKCQGWDNPQFSTKTSP